LQQFVGRVFVLQFLEDVARLGIFALHKWNLRQIETRRKEVRILLERFETKAASFLKTMFFDGDRSPHVQ
jgi:hypothetical protein